MTPHIYVTPRGTNTPSPIKARIVAEVEAKSATLASPLVPSVALRRIREGRV